MFNLKKFWEFTGQPLNKKASNVSRETFVEPTLLNMQQSIKSKLDAIKKVEKQSIMQFCDTQLYKNRVASNGKM